MKQIDKLFDSIKDISKEKTKAYDTQATVTRVDGGTVYVHIPGGVDETPIDKTVSAKPGDVVQVRVANGKAWATGNATAPPTDDSAALRAEAEAAKANQAASSATKSAKVASESAADAQQKATTASTAAATALTKAQEAEDSAEQAATAAATADQKATAAGTAAAAAQTSADQAASAAATADSKATAASSAASRAETSASAASTAASQAVTDAAAAQTAANNAGQAASRAQAAADAAQGEIDDQQEYFWHDALGAHVLSDTDEVTGNRYRTDLKGAGQEIFELDGTTETSVASFGADGARLGETGGAHSVIDEDGQRFYAFDGKTQLANIGYGEGASESGTAVAPYYTFGVRKSGSAVGNYSVAEGQNTKASAYCAHAEGGATTASGESAHAEGGGTTASGICAHAEGEDALASEYGAHAEGGSTRATGYCAHAQNNNTIAAKKAQTAIGKYNIEDTETIEAKQKAFIIGNGTLRTRSNAFTVDWSGNTEAAGDITDGSGNVLSHKADSSSLATVAKTGSYNDLSNKPSLATVATSGSYNDLSNKPSLATVAKTGSYNDLSDKPTIPTADYEELTVTKVGSYYTSGTIVAVKRGGTVTIHVNALAVKKLTARTTVASIPAQYAPKKESYGILTASSSIKYFIVSTDGKIRFNTGDAGTFYSTLTYVYGD